MISNKHLQITGTLTIAILIAGMLFWWSFDGKKATPEIEEVKLDPVEMKEARSEYFFNLLRDPATNRIPDNIRSRELKHAKQVPGYGGGFLRKSQAGQQVAGISSWQLAGPNELGGRTRALAVDQRDPDIILAGGVSGGMWKSTDGGDTWVMTTHPNQNMSVTSLTQDPTDEDTWYYASGEYRGNTASDQGFTANYFGTGIYKSIDNGESWTILPATEDKDTDPTPSEFDFLSKIKVSTSGSIFAASNTVGLLGSTDDGSSFSIIKGGINQHRWTDFDIDQQGNIVVVLSSTNTGSSGSPGIFYSEDDGDSWTEITPSGFPTSHDRSVITFAPSDSSVVYVFSRKPSSSTNQGVSFFKIDISDPDNPAADDRSENLPDFGAPVGGVNTQFSYNMVLSVKPDDPDFVMIGGTNLFRSRDGFATPPADTDGDGLSDGSEKDEYWIGGYDKNNDISQYPGQHPDQHVIAYNPNNPDEVWSGHDGGLSLTTDITTLPVAWQDKDEGYVTGQFYAVALHSDENDDRLLGGTQDNGTPFFRFDATNQEPTSLLDVSSGDGAYAHWGTNYAYVSSQNGNVVRLGIESDGSLTSPYDGSTSTDWSFIFPSGATNQLFIHPYEVDPNDEGIMYYPGGASMWRNTKVDELDSYIQGGTTTDWDDFTAVSELGYSISTLEVTKHQPSDRLYYAVSGSDVPKIFSVENASTSWDPVEISISNADPGAYMHDIAVNPHDGDELIAIMSNYNIVGLYYSTDGGSSWEAIEGNLEGDSSNPGPSLRNATIVPTSSETIYLVGTSTGVYSTTSLSGSNTDWTRESDDGSAGSIGYSVSEYIVSRPVDGKIAVGTHGRGIFVGQTNVDGAKAPGVDITLNIDNNWKLVGAPMASSDEISLGDDLTIFKFSGTYQSSSTIEPQEGYWVKSRSGSEISFSGADNTSATISLEQGWNMIGGITETVSTSEISDPGGIVSAIYEYISGAYQSASEIKPAEGYWVFADQAGDIEIASGGSSKNQLAGNSQDVNQLTFSSGKAAQKFFVTNQELDNSDRKQFLMPPQAPQPILDVRTSDGYQLAEGTSTELELTTNSYPVKVSAAQNSMSDFVLKGITGQDTLYYSLSSGKEASIQRPHEKFLLEVSSGNLITEHNLLPNYPNPFNPTTQIQYQVASQADISIDIYDVIGRKVNTLVDEQHQSGSYTVQFDGSNLSSGIYFIHLKAGNTTKLQKMTLIK